MKLSGLSRLATVFALSISAHASIIFTNMPSFQFGPDPVGVGAIPVPGLFVSAATNFTPSATYRLDFLVLPVGIVSGPGTLAISLFADSGNNPGSLIEAFQLTGLPVPGPTFINSVNSTLHPTLTAGTQYWVAVTGGTPATFGVWALTTFTGNPQAGGASRTINQGVDQGWIRNSGTRVGALEVDGQFVPEPTATLLIAVGLLALAARRKSRR